MRGVIHRLFYTLEDNLAAYGTDYFATYALVLAGRADIDRFLLVFQCGSIQTFILFRKFLHLLCIAVCTNLFYTGSVFAGSVNHDGIFPIVLQRFGFLFLGVVAAAALEGIESFLSAGRGYVILVRGIQHQIVTQRCAEFLTLDQRIALLAVDPHGCRLRAGSLFNNFLSLAMRHGYLRILKDLAQLAGILYKTCVRAVCRFDDALDPLVLTELLPAGIAHAVFVVINVVTHKVAHAAHTVIPSVSGCRVI